MKAEDVAANLEQVASQWDAADPSRGGSHERRQAAAIRALIAERDRLRAALRTTVAALARKEGLSMHATRELMQGRWHPDVAWEVHPALKTARALMEQK